MRTGARVGRRGFLFAAAALVGMGALALLSRLFASRGAPPSTEPARSDPTSIFRAPTLPVLLAVADAVVPRYRGHPAASEVDIVPQLERWANAATVRRRAYQTAWPGFATEIRRRVPFTGDRPEPEALVRLLEDWYEAYRTPGNLEVNAYFFEQLRRDVLRLYYASPAGWTSVGYAGPVHRTHPMVESRP